MDRQTWAVCHGRTEQSGIGGSDSGMGLEFSKQKRQAGIPGGGSGVRKDAEDEWLVYGKTSR